MNLFQMHIMWYESAMLNETLDTLFEALRYSKNQTKLKFCLNAQTYLEKPLRGKATDMFEQFLNHPVFALPFTEVIYKTDDDPFYNIADWRREIYNTEGYTFWGESDCLIPREYFYVFDHLRIDHPHYVAFASRKMWEPSWLKVEHDDVLSLPYTNSCKGRSFPYYWDEQITSDQLYDFNSSQNEIRVIRLLAPKVDGSLLALSPGLPEFIPENMHFVEEDTCAQHSFEKNKIPQYLVSSIIKGHNYHHPLKRTNTAATRNDDLYLHYRDESRAIAKQFVDPAYQRRRKWNYGYLLMHLQRKRNDWIYYITGKRLSFYRGKLVATIEKLKS